MYIWMHIYGKYVVLFGDVDSHSIAIQNVGAAVAEWSRSLGYLPVSSLQITVAFHLYGVGSNLARGICKNDRVCSTSTDMWESCQLLAAGRWFPPGVTRFPPPVKLTRRDIAEISLKRRKALKIKSNQINIAEKGLIVW